MRKLVAVVAALSLAAACGGGGGGGSAGGGGGGGGGGPVSPPPPPPPPPPPRPTSAEAGRLLTQATFGPTEATITQAQDQGINGWITAQLSLPLPGESYEAFVNSREAALSADATPTNFYEAWWKKTVTEPDQLRQRVTFALSQIFVVSMADPQLDEIRGVAAYYDLLQRNAFGNFRTLLEDVTYQPQMGMYLTYLGNQKEDPAGTRTPDENYAREVMQLMTIGLVELNNDGTPRLNAQGQQIPSYTPADIAGLAKVFTGLSWYNPAPNNTSFFGGNFHSDADVRPMLFYGAFHSTSEKQFLGTTIAANAAANTPAVAAQELDTALDRLFNHPNVGPFIAQRLIQQLVTSNPSPAYVGRVATVFNNNGAGVRGDLAAVVRAILTDQEARDMASVGSTSFGKLREPVLRVTALLRATGATSASGNWLISSTSANTSLNQSALTSPSVFNFWRPGFTPPGTTELGSRNLLAPEFQVVDEVTAASYINVMQDWVNAGMGTATGGLRDVRTTYAPELALAGDTPALVDRMNLLFFYGQMTDTLRTRLTTAINAITIPTLNAQGSNQAAIDTARLNRVKTAVFFSVIAPEFLIQR